MHFDELHFLTFLLLVHEYWILVEVRNLRRLLLFYLDRDEGDLEPPCEGGR